MLSRINKSCHPERNGFGFSGDKLIDDAVGEGATRTGSQEIEAYL